MGYSDKMAFVQYQGGLQYRQCLGKPACTRYMPTVRPLTLTVIMCRQLLVPALLAPCWACHTDLAPGMRPVSLLASHSLIALTPRTLHCIGSKLIPQVRRWHWESLRSVCVRAASLTRPSVSCPANCQVPPAHAPAAGARSGCLYPPQSTGPIVPYLMTYRRRTGPIVPGLLPALTESSSSSDSDSSRSSSRSSCLLPLPLLLLLPSAANPTPCQQ